VVRPQLPQIRPHTTRCPLFPAQLPQKKDPPQPRGQEKIKKIIQPSCRQTSELPGRLYAAGTLRDKGELEVMDEAVGYGIIYEESDDLHHAATALRTVRGVEEWGHVPNSREFRTCPLFRKSPIRRENEGALS